MDDLTARRAHLAVALVTRGLRLQDLAALMGVEPYHLTRLRTGVRVRSAAVSWARSAEVLGLDPGASRPDAPWAPLLPAEEPADPLTARRLRLDLALAARDETTAGLARAIGVHHSMIAILRAYGREVGRVTWASAARALDLDPAALAPGGPWTALFPAEMRAADDSAAA